MSLIENNYFDRNFTVEKSAKFLIYRDKHYCTDNV